MFYFTTETLIRALLMAAILDLAVLAVVLWHSWTVLWSANRVLRHIDVEYMVKRNVGRRRASFVAMNSRKTSEQEGSLAK